MLVEIIISFTLAFAILIYLTNLVLKYKDINEDLFYSTKYIKDKNLITRNIMEDLENGIVTKYTINNNVVDIDFKSPVGDEKTFDKRRLELVNENGSYKIKFGELVEVSDGVYEFDNSSVTYYEREIEPSLIVGNIEVQVTSETINFNIPINSIYDDDNYDLNFFWPYEENAEEAIPVSFTATAKVSGNLTVSAGGTLHWSYAELTIDEGQSGISDYLELVTTGNNKGLIKINKPCIIKTSSKAKLISGHQTYCWVGLGSYNSTWGRIFPNVDYKIGGVSDVNNTPSSWVSFSKTSTWNKGKYMGLYCWTSTSTGVEWSGGTTELTVTPIEE